MNKPAPLTLTCAEFQEQLPDLFTEGATIERPELNAHLATCANCTALVRDLKYIADQARQLLEPAVVDPSPDLWSKIQSKLGKEDHQN